MTRALYEEDPYQKKISAKILDVTADGALILDQTIFYPMGGGQPGDTGHFYLPDGRDIVIVSTLKDKNTGQILHIPAETVSIDRDQLSAIDDDITLEIDWQRRYCHMRMHTAMHLISAVIPCGVTGGQVGEQKSRIDFNLGDYSLNKADIEQTINKLIQAAYATQTEWITDEELTAQPELVKTLSVKPPSGQGRIRLLRIGANIDLQPCGGTHVKNTAEIGFIQIGKIENKGKNNRRIHLHLHDAPR